LIILSVDAHMQAANLVVPPLSVHGVLSAIGPSSGSAVNDAVAFVNSEVCDVVVSYLQLLAQIIFEEFVQGLAKCASAANPVAPGSCVLMAALNRMGPFS